MAPDLRGIRFEQDCMLIGKLKSRLNGQLCEAWITYTESRRPNGTTLTPGLYDNPWRTDGRYTFEDLEEVQEPFRLDLNNPGKQSAQREQIRRIWVEVGAQHGQELALEIAGRRAGPSKSQRPKKPEKRKSTKRKRERDESPLFVPETEPAMAAPSGRLQIRRGLPPALPELHSDGHQGGEISVTRNGNTIISTVHEDLNEIMGLACSYDASSVEFSFPNGLCTNIILRARTWPNPPQSTYQDDYEQLDDHDQLDGYDQLGDSEQLGENEQRNDLMQQAVPVQEARQETDEGERELRVEETPSPREHRAGSAPLEGRM